MVRFPGSCRKQSLASVRLLFAVLLLSCSSQLAAAERIDYNRDIRPILADACFSCHGPDEKHRKAKLRLDSREGLLGEARSGNRIIVPGKPEQSELWARVSSDDASTVMPPGKSGKTLKAEQKELLRRWIEQGAAWSSHWAFVAPQRPAVPSVKGTPWVKTPIDAFILARLEREGLKPSPQAERVTLLRRLSLDLIGLPPTPAEVDAFLADKSPDAYRKQVERLLASPHYGERWARHWLDGARYADSDGYEKDKPRFVWAYRDWVINALNRDLPYDRFVQQQIAGDLLLEAAGRKPSGQPPEGLRLPLPGQRQGASPPVSHRRACALPLPGQRQGASPPVSHRRACALPLQAARIKLSPPASCATR